MRELHWDDEGAKAFYRRAADAGDSGALVCIAQLQDKAGDHDGAQATYWQAADRGNPAAFVHLARMREEAGDHDRAEVLYRLAADTGFAYMNPIGAGIHARWPDGLDPNGKPSQPWDKAKLLSDLPNS
ncbi:hypothetical protein [Streptomyces sp. NPDC058964]|uniref:hypothetical protein n=1 Tax=Streptomyces sp. NPDC058964 TaxID=3346681 RepID=UPI0036BE9FB3